MDKYIAKKLKDDAHFVVSLDGLNLSDEKIEKINRGIRDVVLKEIASIDTKGDLVMNKRLDLNPKTVGFKFPILWGIWLEDFGRRFERFNLMNQLK